MNEIDEVNAYGHNFKFDKKANKDIGSYDYVLKGLKNQSWELDTFLVLANHSNKEKSVLDIGAWIGPITMYCSNLYKEVISIEADLVALKAFKENTKDIRNLNLYEKAFVENNFQDDFVYFGENASQNGKNELGNSKSQARKQKIKDQDYKISTINIKKIFDNHKDISIIKCDIEGGEENTAIDLLNACKEHSVDLWLSFHYEWWKNKNLERFNDVFNYTDQMFFHKHAALFEMLKNADQLKSHIEKNPFSTILFKFNKFKIEERNEK